MSVSIDLHYSRSVSAGLAPHPTISLFTRSNQIWTHSNTSVGGGRRLLDEGKIPGTLQGPWTHFVPVKGLVLLIRWSLSRYSRFVSRRGRVPKVGIRKEEERFLISSPSK